MMWSLFIGLAVGALVVAIPLAAARRREDRVVEENQRLAEDRRRLLDFMHLMAEALGEGLERRRSGSGSSMLLFVHRRAQCLHL